MATNESTIASALQERKHYDVFHWVSPSYDFIAANDIGDHYMVHLRSVNGVHSTCTGDSLYLTLQMLHMDQPITPLLHSSHTHSEDGALDEWIIFPIAVRDVPLDAVVECCVHGSRGPVGKALFHPFSARGELKSGPRRYRLCGGEKKSTPPWELLARDLHHGLLQPIPWMDRLVEQRLRELELASTQGEEGVPTLSVELPQASNRLPVFLLSVPADVAAVSQSVPLTAFAATPTRPLVDVGAGDENLCEAKAAAVSRSLFLISNADTQPGPLDRRQLLEIARRPLIQLDGLRVDDEMLLWRFRTFLTRDPEYFIPFMRCVNWDNRAEEQEALKAMQQWKPISFAQALVCLSFYFRKVAHVRNYAIRVLDRQPDERLLRFLLQLVQGVRYDVGDELKQFLLRRALDCWELCSTLVWYVAVEASLEEQQPQQQQQQSQQQQQKKYVDFLCNLETTLDTEKPHFLQRIRGQRQLMAALRSLYRTVMKDPRDRVKRIDLAKALVDARKCGMGELFAKDLTDMKSDAISGSNSGGGGGGGAIITLPTHPCVAVFGITSSSLYMFKSAKMPIKFPFIAQQDAVVGNSDILPHAKSKNIARSTSSGNCNWTSLQDDVSVGTQRESTFVLNPLAHPPADVDIIFKMGDDVRQDQLVVQIIELIDSLLRQDGLDLCLSPYRVLATGADEGLVELVPEVVTFQSVQRDVVKHIRLHNATPAAYQDAMDRFTKSCAGYCVLTFILGIGDRHLENILVTHDGRLLHIDFGYILGNDPKPFPPPMKINKEMVEALGGPQSDGYAEFKSYCCSSYNIIRKHAPLLLGMLLLMVDASIPQISGDGKLDPRVNLLKVQEKLRLDLSNAQAAQYIQNVIADSVGSIFTNLWDVIHVAAQATRH